MLCSLLCTHPRAAFPCHHSYHAYSPEVPYGEKGHWQGHPPHFHWELRMGSDNTHAHASTTVRTEAVFCLEVCTGLSVHGHGDEADEPGAMSPCDSRLLACFTSASVL